MHGATGGAVRASRSPMSEQDSAGGKVCVTPAEIALSRPLICQADPSIN
ncbi:translation elongation factor eEF-1B gamma subunit [Aspergillus luchuensis]|uniref:Translation elongation factor eEF-1B gamma subunit n=1 Tax=Aspergillus kawachii TaxID=1069201 RepID=A0A146EYR4_ASPKA|nr:translation elongation factor eEF-1B gamma subunit [Aspergillus luchuensis]